MERALVDPNEPHTAQDLADEIRRRNTSLSPGGRPWIAFFNDPDTDRVGMIDEHGNVLSGDDLLMFFEYDMFRRYPQKKIVVLDDRASVERSVKLATALGGRVIPVPGGYSNVIPPMETHHAHVGGETTTHIMTDYVKGASFMGIDDGFMNALHLAAILATEGQLPGELIASLERAHGLI